MVDFSLPRKTTLQGGFLCGKIPKGNLVRASKTSWNGDLYLQFEVKPNFLHQVLIEKPNNPAGSL
jgi:hypothetical protein